MSAATVATVASIAGIVLSLVAVAIAFFTGELWPRRTTADVDPRSDADLEGYTPAEAQDVLRRHRIHQQMVASHKATLLEGRGPQAGERVGAAARH